MTNSEGGKTTAEPKTELLTKIKQPKAAAKTLPAKAKFELELKVKQMTVERQQTGKVTKVNLSVQC